MGRIYLALPTLAEQASILAFVQEQTQPMDVGIARTEREIALMQEYRTRLTADVVTGKLDVRPAAAHLPDLANSTPEPATESLDETEPEEAEA
jgi:type I restriction enzyme S subunit